MAKPVTITADDLTPSKKTRPAAATQQRGAYPSDAFVPMQFRMPAEFVTRYKMAAVARGMRLNEFLAHLFEQYGKKE